MSVARRFLIPLGIAILLSATYVPSAGAVIIGLTSFKTSIDVDLKLTEHTKWTGERAGCFAPYENWDLKYNLDIDSRPTRNSKIVSGTTSLMSIEEGSGTSFSFGAKNSFKQNSSNASWELQTQNPADCPAATLVPSWATSPTCKKISERVMASLTETKSEGTDPGDGIVQIVRVRKAKPAASPTRIGDSCYRTLHDLSAGVQDAEVGITPRETMLTVPVARLKQKLENLADGGAKSRPSFRIKVRYWSVCNFFGITPQTASRPGFAPSPFSTAHMFLGGFNGEPDRSICTLSGGGTITVRREGKVSRI